MRVPILLVAIQFLTIGALLVSGPILATGPVWLALEVLGFAVGVWALVAMRLDNLSVTHPPKPGARLVTSGPYRWVRHPMYTSVLLICTALVLGAPAPARWGALGILALDLVVKMRLEERAMSAQFAAYEEYQSQTHRLLPWLY